MECNSCDGECFQEIVAPTATTHQAGGIDYGDTPPTNGAHDPCWVNHGVYDEEVPDERWVHNLEHGQVVFLYNCPDGCPDEVEALTDLVEAFDDWAILTPYSEMDWSYGVVAWRHRLLMNCLDEDALSAFFFERFDHAPESHTGAPAGHCDE